MIQSILLFVLGLVLLVKGADFFVDGASSIAAKLKVPSLIIGLTVVSMGTSLPEAAVSISASLSGSNGISLGNVIGSNMFNLLVVIGISALIMPIMTDRDILKRDLPVNIAITGILLVMLFDGNLSRQDSAILLILLASYMFILIRSALKSRIDADETKMLSWAKSVIFSILGVSAIIFGGDIVVDNASIIARSLGMGETLVGLTIVSIGTSLPELVTSIVAAKKGDSGIAMGNAVGSCIFNILFILGMAGVIHPMAAEFAFIIDTEILIGVSCLMLFFAFTNRMTIRTEGAISTLLYVAYTAYIIMRAFHVWIF